MMNRRSAGTLALTLTIAGAGALVFSLLNVPAAALTGSAVAVSLASLMGAPGSIPTRLRDLCFLVLGVGIGSAVTFEVLRAAITWPLSFLALGLIIVISILISRAILKQYFGFSKFDATLATAPGHLSFVLAIAAENNSDVARISLVQSIRLLFLTLIVPMLLTRFVGATGESYLPTADLSWWAWVILITAASLIARVFIAMNVPAAYLLAGMAASAAGHLSDLTPGKVPLWLVFAALVIMGALIGSRFRGVTRQVMRTGLLAGVVVTLTVVSAAMAGVWITVVLTGLPGSLLFLSFAPGGVEAMAAISVQLGLDPTFVAAHHVFRLVFLTFLLPILFRALKRADRQARSE